MIMITVISVFSFRNTEIALKKVKKKFAIIVWSTAVYKASFLLWKWHKLFGKTITGFPSDKYKNREEKVPKLWFKNNVKPQKSFATFISPPPHFLNSKTHRQAEKWNFMIIKIIT